MRTNCLFMTQLKKVMGFQLCFRPVPERLRQLFITSTLTWFALLSKWDKISTRLLIRYCITSCCVKRCPRPLIGADVHPEETQNRLEVVQKDSQSGSIGQKTSENHRKLLSISISALQHYLRLHTTRMHASCPDIANSFYSFTLLLPESVFLIQRGDVQNYRKLRLPISCPGRS